MLTDYHLVVPVQVRYGDLDAQGHVNNTRFFAYIEQARLGYLQHLGLWDGRDFMNLGVIVGDVHLRYVAPIYLGQAIQVGVRVARLGNKSLTFENEIFDVKTGATLAKGETVVVAYDYHRHVSRPIPDEWRQKIGLFDGPFPVEV